MYILTKMHFVRQTEREREMQLYIIPVKRTLAQIYTSGSVVAVFTYEYIHMNLTII